MANDAKRISDLNVANTLSSTDRVVVLANAATTANVQTITMSDFIFSTGNNMPGPYANDAVANTSGVKLKGLYYDTSGFVKLRRS